MQSENIPVLVAGFFSCLLHWWRRGRFLVLRLVAEGSTYRRGLRIAHNLDSKLDNI
ncbi:hypothetical protein K0A11_21395 [Salmonella enterica subsp. enterica serovar Mbandaka]|nr:hypothetical protein [Salmonella enterica]MCR3254759.1 hypothetical protein [Salmonella enterica subsp. enterica serovar Mbandaka]MCR3282334.1 hypothetical protein [Salmonella enterica subsp. enterica serovar Mbandaka]MCR3316819.1 hypothetical protein [Salmonella enterica subsp. enterica serovar Mbandaka]